MNWFAKLFSSRHNADISDEIHEHLDEKVDELVAAGMSRAEATADARRQFGNVALIEERTREVWKWSWLENLSTDIRYALRMLRKSPGFTIVAILTLALGIGANTAIFSVVNTVILQPLAYPNPDRLVELEMTSPQGNSNITSVPKFNIWREQTQVFDSVAAYDLSGPGINLTGVDLPEQLKGIHASADYFRVFGAPVALGRTFTSGEDRPGGPDVVVISNGLWHSRFGGDPEIIGRSIELGGDPYTIVGVLGPTFTSDPPSDIWLPLKADPNSTEQGHYLRSTARLKPGVSLAQAKAAMALAAQEFIRKFPSAADMAMGPGSSFTAIPLRDSVIGDVRFGLYLLFGAVGFVLLIACANVANLLLVRAAIRRREIAIRAALGAGRARIISQLLTESLLLSLAGGALGLAIGYFGVRALLAINPGGIPRVGEQGAGVTLDWRVLAFTFAAAIVTGILFGLVPALTASHSDLNSTLRESGTRAGGGVRHNKARSVLVVTEMALALVLLVGAALLLRTFGALRGVNPGFDARNVLTMQMSLTGARFEKSAGVDQLERDGRQRLEALPGVAAAAMTCCLPLQGGFGLPFTIEGRPLQHGPYHGGAGYDIISPRYFDVFRIPVLAGRAFNDQDTGGSGGVVILSQGMAKQYWPKGDAIGARITIGKGVGPEFEDPARQIVGIVADVHQGALNQPPPPIMYVPIAQLPDGITALNNRIVPMMWVVRTKYQPFALSQDIQRELRDASGGLPVAHIRSMLQVVGDSTSRNDFYTTLLSIFAGVALLLAAIGVYGLMAYSVQQRTQEIGVRMALGASPQQVRRMVVLQGMLLALIGVIIGVASALALTRLMRTLLFGVKPYDPATIILVAVLLSVVTLVATYLPARRASRVDPMIALRYE
ncbi:MAG: ABC transporter permease [Candidatus Acidiferrales bacterium]